ncbi:methyltransferase domain-containing protein [Robbsia andropogonis]|uniref:methyltransferase domain-containing protein n=1 Tax=Robbsia andropogonis TaxID=28092 RepID=UPI003D23FDDF
MPAHSTVLTSVRRGFEWRAASFGEFSFLPREIASRMHERLDYIKVSPLRILDAGCGLGSDLAALMQRYPMAQAVGVDLAHGMLARVPETLDGAQADSAGWKRKLSRNLPAPLRRAMGEKAAWRVQADFTDLPIAAGSIDLIWSNLALQWHPAPDQVFPSWQRALAVGGLLMFSTVGPDTLAEVRDAWYDAYTALYPMPVVPATSTSARQGAAASALPWTAPASTESPAASDMPRAPVRDFVDMHDFGDMLIASGFAEPVMDMERLTITYREPAALLRDVKGWGPWVRGVGAQGAMSGPVEFASVGAANGQTMATRSSGLMGRRFYQAWLEALDARRDANRVIPLTFEIVYGHAWKAAPKQTADGRAIVRIDEIGGRQGRQRLRRDPG